MTRNQARPITIALATAMLFGAIPAAFALPAVQRTHRNFAQRHPNLTSAAAGIGTYALLKRDAAIRKRRHERLNFMDRHPMLTGIGAAVVTHHVIKKSTP